MYAGRFGGDMAPSATGAKATWFTGRLIAKRISWPNRGQEPFRC